MSKWILRQCRRAAAWACCVASWLALMAVPGLVLAQAGGWEPGRNVEIVVGTSAGGGQDISARFVQKHLQEGKLLKVSSTVVNKPGASTAAGYTYLNQFPGDGNYIMLLTVPLITNYLVGLSPISYNDLTPLVVAWDEYIVATVAPNSALKTGKELLERLRKDPGSVRIGVSAITSGGNLTMAWAAKTAGVNPKALKVVSFKSGGDALTALMGGHIDVVMSSTDAAVQQRRSGTVRILTIAAPQRLPGELSDIATWREHGANVVFSNWRAIIGPRGLSPAQVAHWEGVFSRLMASEEFKRELEKNHWVSNFQRSAETKRFLQEQNDELKVLLTDIGLVKQ
jgi:putative tricarboxylic transport membrane protein